jgi:hypothetical protein
LPDVAAENKKIPRSQWPRDKSGNERPPWSHCAVVQLIHPKTYQKFEFSSGTAGAWRAYRALAGCMEGQAEVEGVAAKPVIELAWQWMPTKYGKDVPAPHFEIVGWLRPGDGNPPRAIEGPKAPPAAAETTLSEEEADADPF